MNDPKHPNDDTGLPPANRIEPAADATPYDLAPEPPPTPPPPQASTPHQLPVPKPGKLAEAGLTDDFDEDADFDTDPEVERALKGEPIEAEPAADHHVDPARHKHRLVKPAGDPKLYASIGGALALAAAFVSGWHNDKHWFYSGLLALYMTIVNTATGVAAIATVAYFEQARLGKVRHAAPRMLVAVAGASLVLSIGVGGYNVITAPLGILTYAGLLAILFRWPPPTLIRVGATHALLIAAQSIAMWLYAEATAP